MRTPAIIAAAVLLAAAFLSVPAFAHPNHAPGDDHTPLEDARQDVEFWTRRAQAAPDDLSTLSRLGQAELALARRTTDHADFARAERTFRRMLGIDPTNPWAPYGLAYALVGEHRFKEALEFARSAALHEPDEPQVVALIADVHLALGHTAEALAIAQGLAEQDLTLETLSRVALAHHAMGRLEAACHSMEEALEAGRLLGAPPAALAWCRSMLGDFALEAADLDRARSEWDAAVLLDPGCHHARWRLAQAALRSGEAGSAAEALHDLTHEVPKPVYLATYADALDADAKTAEAHEARAHALRAMEAEVGTDGLGHLRELAEFLLARNQPGDAARAAELALRDVTEVRQDPEAFDTAAWALFRAGRSAEALAMADQALLRNPSHPRFMARAGVMFIPAGRLTEGRRLLASALQKENALEPALAAEARRVLEAAPVPAPPGGAVPPVPRAPQPAPPEPSP